MEKLSLKDIIQIAPTGLALLKNTVSSLFCTIKNHRDEKRQHTLEVWRLIKEFMASADLARRSAAQNYTHDFLHYDMNFSYCSDV